MSIAIYKLTGEERLENLNIGTEIEITNNFIYNTYNDKTFFVNPTVGGKWEF